jgi:hypothetical protein
MNETKIYLRVIESLQKENDNIRRELSKKVDAVLNENNKANAELLRVKDDLVAAENRNNTMHVNRTNLIVEYTLQLQNAKTDTALLKEELEISQRINRDIARGDKEKDAEINKLLNMIKNRNATGDTETLNDIEYVIKKTFS